MTWDEIRAQLEAELGEPVTIDALTGGWRIAQRAQGHRHSADDVLTAHYALRERPRRPRALDLGDGHRRRSACSCCGGCRRRAARRGRGAGDQPSPAAREHRGQRRSRRGSSLTSAICATSRRRAVPARHRQPAVLSARHRRSCPRTRRRRTPGSSCAATSATTRAPPRATSPTTACSCSAFRPRSAPARSRLRAPPPGSRHASRDVIPRAGAAPLFTLFACRRVATGRVRSRAARSRSATTTAACPPRCRRCARGSGSS